MPRVMGGSVAAHRAEQTRRLFESFRELLYARGYDAITLADIAEHAGLARTAMYHYFADKESLLVAYAAAETEAFLAVLDEELRAIDQPVEQLRAYVQLQVGYFTRSHLPPGPTLRLLVPDPAATAVLGHVAAVEARLQQILRVGRERRYFDLDDIDASVAMISACVSRGAAADPGRSPEESTAATVAFVLRAVGARLGPDGRPRRLPRR